MAGHHGHHLPNNHEEEELAIALAMSLSLADQGTQAAIPKAPERGRAYTHNHDHAHFHQPSGINNAETRSNLSTRRTGLFSMFGGRSLAHNVHAHNLPAAPVRPAHPNALSTNNGVSTTAGGSITGGQDASVASTSTGAVSAGGAAHASVGQRHTKPKKPFSDPRLCAACGKGFGFPPNYISAVDRKWHAACFKCHFCNSSLISGSGANFALGSDGWPYHIDCYKHKFSPFCHICGTYIIERPDGKIEYREHPFWKEKYCLFHQDEGIPQCCACSRMQGRGEEYIKLSDGRDLCLECLSTMIADTKEAQPLYEEVLEFYASLGLKHPETAPVMLVDSHTLDDYSGREGRVTQSGAPQFHVRGLTLATVYRTIPTVTRVGTSHEVRSTYTALNRVRCNVSAILVLYGLPRLLTGCIIAHELMHAWLRMKNMAGISLKVEEGLCQLMAYLWLDQAANKISQSDPQSKLASYFAWQIREDRSPIYGDGFREAFETFQLKGIMSVINSVLKSGQLTEPWH